MHVFDRYFDNRKDALRTMERRLAQAGGARVDRATYPELDSHLRFARPVILPEVSTLLERGG